MSDAPMPSVELLRPLCNLRDPPIPLFLVDGNVIATDMHGLLAVDAAVFSDSAGLAHPDEPTRIDRVRALLAEPAALPVSIAALLAALPAGPGLIPCDCGGNDVRCRVCGCDRDHDCPDCDAEHTCNRCDGTGKTRCDHCDGTGSNAAPPYPLDVVGGVVDGRLLGRFLRAAAQIHEPAGVLVRFADDNRMLVIDAARWKIRLMAITGCVASATVPLAQPEVAHP